MSFTATDLDAINEAIAGGELRVKFKDREVEYRSMDELIKARRLIQRALASNQKSQAFKGSRTWVDRGL
ncbi:phage head-tail joining protein [Spartinivicinus ruber]|uniref:phage head-tail joining protein n=1 Tax=Spartinivicinus ruber TaxID=2683272 RepID=UPI0013D6EBC1|nr:hypothetical protein [Spartinivicinus ruber]